MIVLGLTGSIGMGKSTVARMFAARGVPVHDADARVHALYRGPAVTAIEAAFPGTTAGGVVDRGRLAEAIAGRPEALQRLEGIVHPLVRQAEAAFLEEVCAAGAPIALLDIPLLFETGADRRVDATIVVSAPAEVQRARVLERPGMTAERLEALLARQMPDAEKRQHAHFVIETSGPLSVTERAVADILRATAFMRGGKRPRALSQQANHRNSG